MSVYRKTAHELHQLLTKKEISVQELTKSVLARITRVEDKVKAFVTKVTEDQVIAKAKEADDFFARGEGISPLTGIPMAFKDNICTQGVTTTCSSRMLENFIPPYDAMVSKKMEESKSILIGKTNMDEFDIGSSTESSAFFPTKNPWNLDCVPGGSGGGAAAAVIADEAVFSLGSDILKPSAFCGAVGLKPTYGRVSRYGLIGSTSSLEQIGPVTKDVTDCALVLNAISGYDPNDSMSLKKAVPDFRQVLTDNLKGIKIGMPREYFGKELDQGVKDAVLGAVKQLEDLGAQVSEVSLPHHQYALSAYHLIAAAEASSILARYDGVRFGYRPGDVQDIEILYRTSRSEGFGLGVKRRIILGTHLLSKGQIDVYYMQALKIRTLVKRDFDQAFEKVNLLVSPTCPKTAFPIGTEPDDFLNKHGLYTVPMSLAGIPALTLPCGFLKGLPVGLMIMGQAFQEGKVLQAAYAYEQAGGFAQIKPNLSGEGK